MTTVPSAAAASPAVSALPQTGFIRQHQLLLLIPLSKSTLWRLVRDGKFPPPVKLSVRMSAWRVEDVRSWIEQRGIADKAQVQLQR